MTLSSQNIRISIYNLSGLESMQSHIEELMIINRAPKLLNHTGFSLSQTVATVRKLSFHWGQKTLTQLVYFNLFFQFKVANHLLLGLAELLHDLSPERRKTIWPPNTSFWVFQSFLLLTNAGILFRQTNSLVEMDCTKLSKVSLLFDLSLQYRAIYFFNSWLSFRLLVL